MPSGLFHLLSWLTNPLKSVFLHKSGYLFKPHLKFPLNFRWPGSILSLHCNFAKLFSDPLCIYVKAEILHRLFLFSSA